MTLASTVHKGITVRLIAGAPTHGDPILQLPLYGEFTTGHCFALSCEDCPIKATNTACAHNAEALRKKLFPEYTPEAYPEYFV